MSLRAGVLGLLLPAACAFEAPMAEVHATATDPEFGDGGSVIIDDLLSAGADEYARTLTVLPNGNVVVAVVSALATEVDSTLVWLTSAGQVETTSSERTDAEDYLEVVMADDAGSVYAAGSYVRSDMEAEIAVLKFRMNGEIDPDFGVGGQVPLASVAGRCGPENHSYQVAFGVSLDREGRLLVSGNATEEDCVARDMFVARLDRATGALDPTFGTAGVVASGFVGDGPRSDNGQDVLALPDGRIAVVGNTNDTFDFDTAEAVLWIYGRDGTEERAQVFRDLDGSGAGSDTFRAVAVDDEGRVLVAGRSFNGTDYDAIAVRFDAAGELDRTFATRGVFVSDSGGDDRARRISVDPQARILMVGVSNDGIDDDIAVWRLTEDGALDPSWGSEGLLIIDLGSDERGEGIAFDSRARPFVSASVRRADGTFAVMVSRLGYRLPPL